jgi:hypothetical protein
VSSHGRAGKRKKHTGGKRRLTVVPDGPEAVHAAQLRSVRGLVSTATVFEAELMVSTLFGELWQRRAGAEELIDYLSECRSKAALALLRGIAVLGSADECELAAAAADAMSARGVPEPWWLAEFGAATVSGFFHSADVFDDYTFLTVQFEHGDSRDGLQVVIAHNEGDALVNIVVRKNHDPSDLESPADPERAAALIQRSLLVTEANPETVPQYQALEGLDDYRALLWSLLRKVPALPLDEVAPPTIEDAYRAAIVADFLAAFPSSDATAVRFIVDYGCDHDNGRPLRISDSKLARLLEWAVEESDLPQGRELAVVEVLPAWCRWAAGRTGMLDDLLDEATEELPELIEDFQRRLDQLAVGRRALAPLLAGLERVTDPVVIEDALRRRMYAVAMDDVTTLDPADPDDRRLLVRDEHADCPDRPGQAPGSHLGDVEAVVAQLWDGVPAEVWQFVRYRDGQGVVRIDVLDELAEIYGRHRGDADGYRTELAKVAESD